jgi:hypothetical protein
VRPSWTSRRSAWPGRTDADDPAGMRRTRACESPGCSGAPRSGDASASNAKRGRTCGPGWSGIGQRAILRRHCAGRSGPTSPQGRHRIQRDE